MEFSFRGALPASAVGGAVSSRRPPPLSSPPLHLSVFGTHRFLKGARPASVRHVSVVAMIQVTGPLGDGPSRPTGPGSSPISKELVESMRRKISEALATDRVQVADVSGDGQHVSIDVVSAAFEGASSMERQRMVYKAIWLELQEAVHAVDEMTTQTPEEASADDGRQEEQ